MLPTNNPQSHIALPDSIDLLSLIPHTGPSINDIILGVSAAPDEPGGIEIVKAPLSKLVHVGIGGSSGWGKSSFLMAWAFQIAMNTHKHRAELALIDIEAQTFSPFVPLGKDRLRYPVVDEMKDIQAVLQDLNGELERRKAYFKQYPQVADLDEYNATVISDEQLPFVVVMIDEATTLLDESAMKEMLLPLALRARKYGIFCVLGGQDWGASSVPTKLRNQFSTRIQFKAMGKSQSRVMLEDSSAAEIEQLGRAYAVLRGRSLFELQTPYIDKQTILETIDSLGQVEHPVVPQNDVKDEKCQQGVADGGEDKFFAIQKLIEEGKSNDEIAKTLGYKRAAGAIFYEIKEIRDSLATTTS